MKNALYLLLFFLLTVSGCGKKYTCSYNNYYQLSSVAFTGSGAGALPYFVVKRYIAQTQFTGLLGTDTIETAGAFVAGDTLCRSFSSYRHEGFFKVESGIDYKIMIPGGKEFTITGVKPGDTTVTWTQKEHCSPGASQARIVPLDFVVTGGGVSGWYPGEANNYFIFLPL